MYQMCEADEWLIIFVGADIQHSEAFEADLYYRYAMRLGEI